jgi:hypothetical protein
MGQLVIVESRRGGNSQIGSLGGKDQLNKFSDIPTCPWGYTQERLQQRGFSA